MKKCIYKLVMNSIVIFMASHLDCQDRLSYFLLLLEDIKEQQDCSVDGKLYLSISYDAFLTKEKLEVLLQIANTYHFQYFLHDQKLSQFEHYKYLVEHANVSENSWILFSDDDDNWSELRYAVYQHLIDHINPEDVKLLAAIKYQTEDDSLGSYVDYCIKWKYFKNFLDKLSMEQLQHRYCDMYLIKYIETIHLQNQTPLKVGYCQSPEILYSWEKRDYQKPTIEWKEHIQNILDLFFASQKDYSIEGWLSFCNSFLEDKIEKKEIDDKAIKYLIKIFHTSEKNHLFHTKHLFGSS
jgi:hypothetical protein